MRCIFLSGGARAKTLEYILDQGVYIAAVVTPHPSEKNSRFLEVILTAEKYGIEVIYAKRDNLYEIVCKMDFDVLISCGYSYRIEKEVLHYAKYAINVHPTLLPNYRGFRSGNYILINGEKKSGVTVHFITEEMDCGDIIRQEEFEVTPFDTPKSMYRKTQEIEGRILYQALTDIEKNQIHAVKQEGEGSEYNKVRTPEDSQIDWKLPLRDLYNTIRACDPEEYPAFFYVNGEKVCIRLWRSQKPDEEQDMI